jgi:hypothetical protein
MWRWSFRRPQGLSAYNQTAQKKHLGIFEPQMEPRSPIKITFLISVLFLAMSSLIAYEFAVGSLSPRGMGFALLALCVVAAVAFAFVIADAARHSQSQRQEPLTEAVRKRRLRKIKIGKIAIIVLVFALFNGLLTTRNGPFWPVLVGATMNILMTVAIARGVIRLQRSLQDDTQPRS